MMIDPEIRDLEVPWPDNWQFRKPSARADVREIEWETARELAEQSVWRDRLEALEALDLRTDALDRMAEFDGSKLCAQMDKAGAMYPPTWEDEKTWVERLGHKWDWDQSSSVRQSRIIADSEMRSAVYWLLETRAQKERIKAFVLFASILKVSPAEDDTYRAFTMWKLLSIFEALTREYGEQEGDQRICN